MIWPMQRTKRKLVRELAYREQAMRPTGALGRIMGEIMAATNRPRNRWLLKQLDLVPELTGLEFGFGNGEILADFLRQCVGGRALGVDWSQSMIDLGARRNKGAVADGRLRLQLGDITDATTLIEGSFDRIWCSNVIQMIEDRPALFGRLRANLTPNGLLAICFQPRGGAPPAATLAPLCEQELTDAGFTSVQALWLPNATTPAFCIVAKL